MYGRVYNKQDNSKAVNGPIIKGEYVIQMMDCYAVKEQLKELGYKWNPNAGAWCLTCKTEELGNAIAEVVVKVNLPIREYKQMIAMMCNIEIDWSAVSLDAEHIKMIENHYKK